ncbi:MAG: TRAP-type C4-dicarboxylate transport system, substrate-binding protein [Myxococcales bacterium]|nr:TRAP-type C4-dicarboxylate transport system, substrate-binding protein [Myxococcales bacterium]
MTMSKLLLGAVTALAVYLPFGRPAHADPVELRLATLAPSGSPWMEVLNKAQGEIATKTSSRVTLKYFEGGQQGDERDFVRKIKLGQLDGAAVTSIGLAMIDESIRVLELPMMFSTAEEMDYVADKMWPYFQKKFEKKGFKLNDRGEVGWIYFLSKSKVESLKDLKGLKLWQWGDDQLVGAMFKKLSLNGVPLGVPEVDAGLTSGKIDACYGSPVAAVALQWYSKIKYMTSMPMSFAIGATVVSLESLKKLSAEDQKSIEEIGKASAKKLRKVIRKANDDAKGTMQRKGITVIQTPPAMVSDFTTQSQDIWKDLIGKIYSKEELDMVLKYRDEYRAKHKPADAAPAAAPAPAAPAAAPAKK